MNKNNSQGLDDMTTGQFNQKEPGEVEVVQYLRPNGRTRLMYVDVGEDYAARAVGLRLSAEELGTGQVAVYAKRNGEPTGKERSEIAENGPGPNSPANALKRLIDKLAPVKKGG